MDRINAIALLWLLNQDLSHLHSIEDFIKQFDTVVLNVKGIDENLSTLKHENE